MTTVIITIAFLICLALCGWTVAELKANHCIYEHNEEEKAAELIQKNGFHELNIKDVIATISTKGFKA